MIITSGFGHALSWEEKTDSSGQMSLKDAFTHITHHHVMRLLLPRWAYKLPIKKYVLVLFEHWIYLTVNMHYQDFAISGRRPKSRWSLCTTSSVPGGKSFLAALLFRATF